MRVTVVGGGPAGLAASIALAQRGISARVLEPRPFPIDKPCGEGLMPDGVAALDRLGVDLEGAGLPIRGITYLDREVEVSGRFPGQPGRGVRRPELHRRLLERARALGVEVRGERALGLEITAARARVELERDSIESELVLGADGLRSRVRRWADLERRPRSSRARFGVRRHYALEPWSDRVEVAWSDGVEAYTTPVAEREVGIALLWQEGALETSRRLAGASPAPPAFDRLLGRFPDLEERLRGARRSSRTQGIGPLEQRCREVRRGPVVLVGDAAGYLDAITGEGLALAFQQALALAEAWEKGRLEDYERAHRRLLRRADWMTRLALVLSPRPRLRRRFLRSLARDPSLFDRLLKIHVGEARGGEVVASAARVGLGLVLGARGAAQLSSISRSAR